MLTGLDHVRLAVPDLDRATDAWSRLGFTVTPEHTTGDGAACRLVMLVRDHLELVAGEAAGLEALALATSDAAATAAAWRHAGLFTTPTEAAERRLAAAGTEASSTFAEVTPKPGELADLPVVASERLGAAELRRPEWLRHANGADRVTSLTVVVEATEPCAVAMDKLVGPAALTWTDRILAARLGRVALVLVEPGDVELLHADAVAPGPLPRLIALGFGVPDLARAEAALVAGGVDRRARPDGSLGVAAAPDRAWLVELRSAA